MAPDFRSLTPRDLKLVGRWLAEPHVRQWRGDPGAQLERIAAALDNDAIEPMIAEHQGKAFAYVEACDPHLEEGHPFQDQPTGTLCIDFFIGEPAMLRQGHGAGLLAGLSQMYFEEGVPRLVAGPDARNTVAILTCRKAGFDGEGLRETRSGPAMLLALNNDELLKEGE